MSNGSSGGFESEKRIRCWPGLLFRWLLPWYKTCPVTHHLLSSPNVARTCMTLGDEVFKKKKSVFGEHQTNPAQLIVQEIKYNARNNPQCRFHRSVGIILNLSLHCCQKTGYQLDLGA